MLQAWSERLQVMLIMIMLLLLLLLLLLLALSATTNATTATALTALQVVLLLNKIDRLILELKMSVNEAAAALAGIVTGDCAVQCGVVVISILLL